MIKPFFENIRQRIVSELRSASVEIKVAVCWFTNTELFDVLCEKLSEGIPVTLIVLNDIINNKEDGLKFQKFIDLGGVFYFSTIDAPMHNKYCIIDKKIVVTGSYNWTYNAENKNSENIIVIADEQISIKFAEDFDKLIKGYNEIYIVKNSIDNRTDQVSVIEGVKIALESDIVIRSRICLGSLPITLKHSLGLSANDGSFIKVIAQSTVTPKSERRNFYPTSNNHELVVGDRYSCKIDVRYGESLISSENKQLGYFVVENIPVLAHGTASLDTTLLVDIYGVLTLSVKVKETEKVTIQRFNVEHLLNL